jgi:diguanylate cyclase (GGDEF)-like protein/PAS domain S-box-containing protein
MREKRDWEAQDLGVGSDLAFRLYDRRTFSMCAGENKPQTPNSVEQAVHTELVCLLFGSPAVPSINGVAAVVTTGVMWGIFPDWISLSWLILLLSIVFARLQLWAQFKRRGAGAASIKAWARRFTLSAAATGCVWGLVAATAFVASDPVRSVFAAFVVGGLCAGAAIRLSPHPPAFYAFVATSAPPMVIALLRTDTSVSLAMSGLLLVFILVMILVGRENHQRLADYIRLKSEQEVMNKDLQKVTCDLTEQIAEKEKIALALEETSKRFRAIGDNALDAIIISDSRGRVAYWNAAAERTFGFTADETVGRSIHSLLACPKDREKAEGLYMRFALTGQGQVLGKTIRLRALRKDGAEFPADLSVSAMSLGGSWHALGIVRDVSDQENALAALRRRESDLTTIAKISDALQSCRTIAEAYPIIANGAAALFPMTSGSLAIVDLDTQDIKQVSDWGANQHSSLLTFQHDHCQALRNGSQYESTGSSPVRCQHLSLAPGSPYLCLPLKMQGKTLGLVSLVLAAGSAFDEATRQVLHSFAEVVNLSLANIQLRESLAEQAFRDPLTSLFNRRYLMEILPREIRRAQRRGAPLTIAMLDIDHFKRFNDQYGHDAGDFVLTEVALQLAADLRAEDVVCRYGGEEFLALMPECTLTMAHHRMTDITRKIRSRISVFHGGALPATTLSIGLAVLSDALLDSDALITAADKAMYAAKHMGRDRIECFQPSPADCIA